MNICLFGGAFDPPHRGHLQIARSLLQSEVCDEVWFVPVREHAFGKQLMNIGENAGSTHRVKMLEIILEDKMKIETYELDHPGMSISFDTLEALSKVHHDHTFSWVIGTDNLEKFHLWDSYKEFLKKYTVYVYPRKGFPFTPWYPGMKRIKDAPIVDVSSTKVREKLRNNESITGLVDPGVEEYIMENKLYL